MQDDAAIWAAPAIEEFANGGMLFNHSWKRCCEQFKMRFEMVDEAVKAKEKLCILWQDTSTIPKYAALFKELMACTRYLSAHLYNWFYKHLSACIKNKLVHTACPINTLNKLVTIASNIGVQIC
jgi:Retrotransposon gag protein